MARKCTVGSVCWRVMSIADPRNSAEVDAEGKRHTSFLKERYGKSFYFSGEVREEDGTYWGRFTAGSTL